MKNIKLTIVMLCRNDVRMIGNCIDSAKKYVSENEISAEYIVVDMGSSDGSVKIAKSKGAKVIQIGKRGIGVAAIRGIANASGRYIILGTCDGRFDFYSLAGFVRGLDAGYDMVVGNRFASKISKEAMSFCEKYIAMPVLSFLFRVKYNTFIDDHFCEFIAFRRNKVKVDILTSCGRRIIPELMAQFLKRGYKLAEIPVTYYKVKNN